MVKALCLRNSRCLINVSSFSPLQGVYSLVGEILPLILVVVIVGVGAGIMASLVAVMTVLQQQESQKQ